MHCNICNIDIVASSVEEHLKSKEHEEGLERLRHMFNGKVYEDHALGINP